MKYDIENKVGYVMKPLCARMLLEVCNNKLCKYFLLDMLKKIKELRFGRMCQIPIWSKSHATKQCTVSLGDEKVENGIIKQM